MSKYFSSVLPGRAADCGTISAEANCAMGEGFRIPIRGVKSGLGSVGVEESALVWDSRCEAASMGVDMRVFGIAGLSTGR